MHTLTRIVATASILAALVLSAPALADDREQRAVLITGASSGIGRYTAELLASEGYFVYAGARKQSDIDSLNKLENVQAIRLDVTIQDEVDAAVAAVRDGGRGLYALVNNAGVVGGAPLIEMPEEDLRWLFDVNVFGVFKVTRAFAPLIIESNGRITNISSISGVLTWPGGGDYTMSKHAIEAFSETLALELARFDVHSSVVEPGNYQSDIVKSLLQRRGELTEEQEQSPFRDIYRNWSDGPVDRSNYKPPHEVAAAILHSIASPAPKLRYLVVPNQEEAGWTIEASIARVAQRNERQQHAFSRDELIAMLDKALAAESGDPGN